MPVRRCSSSCGPVADIDPAALGLDLARGERPQVVVPADCWQSARSLGGWTLVGCTVAPGFTYDKYELAPPAGTRLWSARPGSLVRLQCA